MARWGAREPIIDRIIGESTDPDGNQVILLGRVWRAKVLSDHPELDGHVDAVLQAVAAPDHTTPDPVFDHRQRYYLRGVGPNRWLLVVVSYE